MAESKFIRTVTYGGYDRTDVNKRLEMLYAQVYDLKNELRETKLTLEEYKKGTSEEKAHESALAVERNKLTDEQVQNEKLTLKLKTAEQDLKASEEKNAELTEKNKSLEAALDEAKKKVAAYEAGNDPAALSTVFIEAQKSATMVAEDAAKKAAEKTADAELLAEDTVAEANNKAKQIIYDAEKEAARITADAKTKADEMDAASGNLRSVLLADVEKMTAEVENLRGILDKFYSTGKKNLEDSQSVLNSSKNRLMDGGVPVFRMPEHFKAEETPEPALEDVNTNYSQNIDKAAEEAKQKKNEELEKLAAMAASIGKGKGKDKPAEKPKAEEKKSGGVDLDALMAQASALGGGKDKGKEKPKAEEKKSGGVDLADLMAQANALGKK